MGEARHHVRLRAIDAGDGPQVGHRHEGVLVPLQRQGGGEPRQRPEGHVPGGSVEQRRRALRPHRQAERGDPLRRRLLGEERAAHLLRPDEGRGPRLGEQERGEHVGRLRQAPEGGAEAHGPGRGHQHQPRQAPAGGQVLGHQPPERIAHHHGPSAQGVGGLGRGQHIVAQPGRPVDRPGQVGDRDAMAAPGEPGRDEAGPDHGAGEGAMQEQKGGMLAHAPEISLGPSPVEAAPARPRPAAGRNPAPNRGRIALQQP